VFLFAVLGGVTSVGGVMFGSAYYALISYFFPTNFIFLSLRPFSVIGILWVSPGGFVALLNRMRDAGLRIIAQRRQIIVPSLFADFDASVLEKRLIPLSEPLDAAGLATLDAGDRYAIESELYGRDAIAGAPSPAREESAAFEAAAAGTREAST
jgi:hypothetical protein